MNNKALWVMVVLMGCALAISFGSASTPNAISTSLPVFIARGWLVDQTAPIPTTTILTPPQDGLYRLSVYATITKAGNGSSFWSYNPQWTDDSGEISNGGGVQFLSSTTNDGLGSFTWSGGAPYGATMTFEAKGGTAIAYSVTQTGPPDSSAYSLYFTLERLE